MNIYVAIDEHLIYYPGSQLLVFETIEKAKDYTINELTEYKNYFERLSDFYLEKNESLEIFFEETTKDYMWVGHLAIVIAIGKELKTYRPIREITIECKEVI